MIQFVANYEDLSTDRGYQFKFYCDKCGNGYMSRYEASALGTAGSLLRSAGNIFGGWLGTAGNSAYDIQRSVGGRAHDEALARAVVEGRDHFHQCSRCGKWVCPEVCWNAAAGQCEACAPDYREEMAAAHAQAKADVTREQLHEKARATDYVSQVDMRAGATVKATSQGGAKTRRCAACDAEVGQAKFCPECGTPAAPPKLSCAACGHEPEGAPKFCPECGAKMK